MCRPSPGGRAASRVREAAPGLSLRGARRTAGGANCSASAGAALLLALVAAIGLMAYVIFFRAAPPAEPGGAAALGVSRLMVSPFQPVSDTPETATLARGLTEEVVRQLSLFKEIDLVAGPRPVTGQSHPPAQYELQGSIRLEDRRFRLTARLVDNDDGSIIWAENYDGDRDVSQLLETQATIAGKVATAVAQPYGVIFHTDAAKLVRETPNDWEAYACTLAYYSYRADLNPTLTSLGRAMPGAHDESLPLPMGPPGRCCRSPISTRSASAMPSMRRSEPPTGACLRGGPARRRSRSEQSPGPAGLHDRAVLPGRCSCRAEDRRARAGASTPTTPSFRLSTACAWRCRANGTAAAT